MRLATSRQLRKGIVESGLGTTATQPGSAKRDRHRRADTTGGRASLDEELRLHQRIVEGDESALLECLDRAGHLVYCSALLRAGNSTAADDLTEAVFVDLWREPEAFHPAHGPIALQLMRRIARRLSPVP
ncbi:MAG: hypothetical protein M3314_01130 [Actinomycetota bacterium]|nr:hypothetical protein [Actinomycetota bacterium]